MSDPAADPPTLIGVALNGPTRLREIHPRMPVDPEGLAEAAAGCMEAGAALVQVHARDRDGHYTLEPEAWRASIGAIRQVASRRLVIQAGCCSGGRFNRDEQMIMVREVKPEAVILDLQEIAPDEKSLPQADKFLSWLGREYIVPQYRLTDNDAIRRYLALRERGVIPDRPHEVAFVLGRENERSGEPTDLLPLLSAWTAEVPWSLAAHGARESACGAAAAALGGHLCPGFEYNVRLADGALARDNAALVRQSAEMLALLGLARGDADAWRGLLLR